MEQPDSGHRHRHMIFIAGFNHIFIPHRAAGLRDIGNAALCSSLDVVSKWEESIGCQTDAFDFRQILPLLFFAKRLRFYGKQRSQFPSASTSSVSCER